MFMCNDRDEREKDGFTIVTRFFDDDQDWRDFTQDDDIQETAAKIESGAWVHFAVDVYAVKAGVELGCDSMGGCIYDSYQAFIDTDGYWGDMVANAIDRAKSKLAELTA